MLKAFLKDYRDIGIFTFEICSLDIDFHLIQK